jgi:hypothetical protein
MTCRCRAQFCYICGLKWRTCQCTEEDLVRVQREAAGRRTNHEARIAIADAEAEEERAILAEVEAFMRQEAEEAARIAEEERLAAEESRMIHQQHRMRSISLRYYEFNKELDLLHSLQQIPMAERHEFEQDVLTRERQNALGVLAFRHPSEIKALQAEASHRYNSAKQQFESECHARLATEQRIEDEYLGKMNDFWAGRPECNDRVREAREKYRETQSGHKQFWNSYQRDKLQEVKATEEERLQTLKVRQAGEVKTANSRGVADEMEFRRRRWAEWKWVEVLLNERHAMLRELESEELVRGD